MFGEMPLVWACLVFLVSRLGHGLEEGDCEDTVLESMGPLRVTLLLFQCCAHALGAVGLSHMEGGMWAHVQTLLWLTPKGDLEATQMPWFLLTLLPTTGLCLQ